MILTHVIISIAGIVTGLIVLFGLIGGKRLSNWTTAFLATNIATSLTGYAIPADRLLPSHIVGVLALLALAGAIVARYTYRMAGAWRTTYVVTSTIAVYFNVFVLVVQSFLKIPVLNALAPTQSEAPFVIAQTAVLIMFVIIGIMARRRFQEPEPRLARLAATTGR